MKDLDRLVEWFKKRVSVHKHEEHHLKFIMTEYAKIYHTEQLALCGVVATLPNIESDEFKEFLISEGFTKTLNSFLYKRGDDEYDKDILYTHFCNVIEFGN